MHGRCFLPCIFVYMYICMAIQQNYFQHYLFRSTSLVMTYSAQPSRVNNTVGSWLKVKWVRCSANTTK